MVLACGSVSCHRPGLMDKASEDLDKTIFCVLKRAAMTQDGEVHKYISACIHVIVAQLGPASGGKHSLRA